MDWSTAANGYLERASKSRLDNTNRILVQTSLDGVPTARGGWGRRRDGEASIAGCQPSVNRVSQQRPAPAINTIPVINNNNTCRSTAPAAAWAGGVLATAARSFLLLLPCLGAHAPGDDVTSAGGGERRRSRTAGAGPPAPIGWSGGGEWGVQRGERKGGRQGVR